VAKRSFGTHLLRVLIVRRRAPDFKPFPVFCPIAMRYDNGINLPEGRLVPIRL